jgi:hypothetical protein
MAKKTGPTTVLPAEAERLISLRELLMSRGMPSREATTMACTLLLEERLWELANSSQGSR